MERNNILEITEVLIALDGIKIEKCIMYNLTIAHQCNECNEKSGRFFENVEGKIYEACNEHLSIYLKYYRGGPDNGGWKEIIIL